jgi:elongation factor G
VWATLPPAPAASRSKAAAAPAEAQLPQAPPRVAVSIDDAELAALAFKVVWDKRRGPLTFVRVYAGE